MAIVEITAKTVLRRMKRIDSWFLARYSMNLYRGCVHNCAYCDGRAESYRVEGAFGNDVAVKVNAVDVLARELDPARRRKPLPGGYALVGGGVGDGYQPAEEVYGLTARAIEMVSRAGFGVHLLTKSDRILHDTGLIADAHKRNGALVSFSFSTVNPDIAAVFEPGTALPAERLRALSALRNAGVPAGAFLMPVIPFVTDTLPELDRTFRALKEAGADYAVFGGMTLKEGRQRDHFMRVLQGRYPHLAVEYASIYKNDRWGRPAGLYNGALDATVAMLGRKYGLPLRIPVSLTGRRIGMNDRITVILDQLDYLVRLGGGTSPYGKAAYAVSQLAGPVEAFRGNLKRINGIGPVTERLIREILDSGSAAYYRKLLYYR